MMYADENIITDGRIDSKKLKLSGFCLNDPYKK